MKQLLNSLFILTPDLYLSLDNENVVVNAGDKIAGCFPIHTLENILYFGYKGASPALMGECAERGVNLSFFKPSGRFLGRVVGASRGNVLLRKQQYRIAGDLSGSCKIARNFIVGKIFNARSVVNRCMRDHALSVDIVKMQEVSHQLFIAVKKAKKAEDLETLRGIEGDAARQYFSVFNDLILQNKTAFVFIGRSKRPPLDRTNAVLSFLYTVLANDCAAALEGAGLDAYVGFLHRDRPGRSSLALDIMEELRHIFADRLVLSLINNRQLSSKHFEVQENGAVLLSKNGRQLVLDEWQSKKRETITHPFLNEKIPWGMVCHLQALLLARYLRGDLEEYPAFLWK